jgi:hypothetical protein
LSSSSAFPLSVATFFLRGHFPGSDRITVAVGKADGHAEQIPAWYDAMPGDVLDSFLGQMKRSIGICGFYTMTSCVNA